MYKSIYNPDGSTQARFSEPLATSSTKYEGLKLKVRLSDHMPQFIPLHHVPNNKLYILTLVTTLMILSEILLARNF
jgi:hypothetical protein